MLFRAGLKPGPTYARMRSGGLQAAIVSRAEALPYYRFIRCLRRPRSLVASPVPRYHQKTVPVVFHQDAADLAEDARRLLLELDRDVPGAADMTAECRPPLDVLETASSVEVVVDLPGVSPDSIRVAIRRSTLLIVGAKVAVPATPGARVHVAERSYGRFARAVRVGGAFDASRVRAIAGSGQIRVILPRLDDRRGHVLKIPVERA